MSCKEFVGLLFAARDVAHSAHLSTRSYAKHVALGAFYDGVVDLADKFAEAYQGRHGLMGAVKMPPAAKAANILEYLEGSLKEVEKMRYDICDKSDSALQNIIDEIVGLYLSTIYKLKFLA